MKIARPTPLLRLCCDGDISGIRSSHPEANGYLLALMPGFTASALPHQRYPLTSDERNG